MPKTVKVPGIGAVRQDYVLVGGAVVAGVVGYMYVRQRNNAAIDPSLLETVDPGAGLIENTPQYQSSGEPGLYGPDGSGGYGEPRPGHFITNAEWYQYAVNYLDGQLGIDRSTAGSALAKYLERERVTTIEAGYIRQAISAAGPPPQNGPFQILPVTGGGTTPPPPGGGGSGTPGAITGLVFEGGNSQDLTWRWKPAQGAVKYRVRLIQGTNSVVAGSEAVITTTRWRVQSTYRRPLPPNRPFRIEVWPISGTGVQGPRASANGRTTR